MNQLLIHYLVSLTLILFMPLVWTTLKRCPFIFRCILICLNKYIQLIHPCYNRLCFIKNYHVCNWSLWPIHFCYNYFLLYHVDLKKLVNPMLRTQIGRRVMYFLYHGENVCLLWKTYLLPFVHRYGKFISFMLKWFRAWLNHQLKDIIIHMIVPYNPAMLTQSVNKARCGMI